MRFKSVTFLVSFDAVHRRPGPGAIKFRQAHFGSVSLLHKKDIVEKARLIHFRSQSHFLTLYYVCKSETEIKNELV